MPRHILISTVLIGFLAAVAAHGGDLNFSDPEKCVPAPAGSPGFPSRAAGLDALPGFANPPVGYGEVPFWWWTGDPLDKDRLLWQIEQLHAKGLSGMQVNYAHLSTEGCPTYPAIPELFTKEWWNYWEFATKECRKRGMGIGLSCYTLDWPFGGKNLFLELGITDGSLSGSSLSPQIVAAKGGQAVALDFTPNDQIVCVMAYRQKDNAIEPGSGQSLVSNIHNGKLRWTPPEGAWQVVAVRANTTKRSVDPMNPASGKKVIEKFFQPFADHCPGESGKALNYFFQDELTFGVGGWIWTKEFAKEFQRRKGYDVVPLLPALFTDIGPRTPKIRLDYADVMVSLSEENYFRPIFDWHQSRGLIYGCDPCSRGLGPSEFGDYFRCVRWYTAPGNDTPGASADFNKEKVASSIAHLYRRPRVWLEGYHSLGWGATPATIFNSSSHNFLYGASLLNLHGLYYTTHGGFWEWAPPCYHFRMPYWDHMGGFLKHFERLSYLLSQGVHSCDVAIVYPVAPFQADMGGNEASGAAFGGGSEFYHKHGIDFDFIDFESLARAKIEDRELRVSGEAYRALVLPAMRALNASTIEQALAFFRKGGVVVAYQTLPEASDIAGRDDPKLDAMVKEIFGLTAREAKAGQKAAPQTNAAGGLGVFTQSIDETVKLMDSKFPRQFVSDKGGHILHRKIGARDVFMVMDAPKNSECTFRAKGCVELWDAWTGKARPIYTAAPVEQGTRVRLPLDGNQSQLIVFSPGAPELAIEKTDLTDVFAVEEINGQAVVKGTATAAGEKYATILRDGKKSMLSGKAARDAETIKVEGPWQFELRPTMNNRWGDFRLPAFDRMIGAEARQFRYADETASASDWQSPNFNHSSWKKVTCSFGPRFWRLGPMPENIDVAAVEKQLAGLKQVDPAQPVEIGGKKYSWQPYEMSMQWGVQDDPGPQGYHGLKENVVDDFLVLGNPKYTGTLITYEKPAEGGRYFFWTSTLGNEGQQARILTGDLKPASLWINGSRVTDLSAKVRLSSNANPILARYDNIGRTHLVLEQENAPKNWKQTHPLAMQWYNKPGVLPFDACPQTAHPVGWYRFVSPPGFKAMNFVVRGAAQAWADGKEMKLTSEKLEDGSRRYQAKVDHAASGSVVVAIRVEQQPGCHGGDALPEYVALDCSPGEIALGDWSLIDGLASYSGGAWYRKTVTLDRRQCDGQVLLNLGNVAATAEIVVNGRKAGVLVSPPWKIDVSKFVKPGENRVEVLVYNTLANHYLTIPTHYRGSPASGLLGPVTIESLPTVELKEP